MAYLSARLLCLALSVGLLGDRFRLSAFHDEVLSGGAWPMDVLSKRIHEWVAAQNAKTEQSSGAAEFLQQLLN